MEEADTNTTAASKYRFWWWSVVSIIFRLLFMYFPITLNLSSRPEVSTPLTSLRRLAEGHWLKKSSMSPYAGSMYHGSPLLLSVLGPLTITRNGEYASKLMLSLVFVTADFMTGILIRAIGKNLMKAYNQSLKSLDIVRHFKSSATLSAGDIAALVYLWNPLTLVACVGSSTSPVENFFIILSLYGACARLIPLAAFGWVIAAHLSFYPIVLVIPIILLLGYRLAAAPRKLFLQTQAKETKVNTSCGNLYEQKEVWSRSELSFVFSWKPVLQFILWATLWTFYVIILCSISVKSHGGLWVMFKSTYGFILTVEDLSPNIGVLWYFFAEVFDFFRNFFLIAFHVNILFMIVPLAIRLNHRPCFLAFTYVTICSMVKSYPSVGDSALYLGLLCLFVNELSDMKFSFFLFCGYVGVFLLSPVMHNLWIWRGTGNANFYFATAMVYACLQIILLVESVGAMVNHDRKLRKASLSEPGKA